MRLLVVVFVAAFGVSICTGHQQKRSYWRRRPALIFERMNCDRIKIADLCHCCKDPCDDVECLNNGVCVDGICNCPCGFSGSDCGVDLCAAEFCQNNGTCVPEASEVSCKCEDGFTGDNCEVDLCASEPCQNGGTCVPETGGVSCNCVAGFTGDFCEKDECEPNPCENCGTCSRIEGGFKCTCLDRINGTTCEVIDNIVTSPNYPDNYPGGSIFQFRIPGCAGKQIRIVFDEDFVVQEPDTTQCEQGSSLINDNDDFACPDVLLLESQFFFNAYCGGTAPPTLTSPGDVDVTLSSDDDGIQCKGFKLSYTYVDV
ncbi:hypothetical protein SNE40_017095 [Patella caerulea]|uniref:Uncharacterized protein n=1 Tax=Patella caerulea TaxID=87958 RepID=A0AAN8JEC0_PATCE